MEVQLYVLLFFAKMMCSSPNSLVFLFLLEIIKNVFWASGNEKLTFLPHDFEPVR